MNAETTQPTIVYLVRHGDAIVPLDSEGHRLLYGLPEKMKEEEGIT